MRKAIGLLFAAALAASAPTSARAAAGMTVTPTSGPPTTPVTVKITGFAAGKFVDVYFDTTDQCLILTDGSGNGSCAFKVPGTARSQTHWLSAVARATGSGLQRSFLVRTDWLRPRGPSLGNDGFNRYENTLSTANVSQLDVAWSVLPDVAFLTTPIVVSGRLYVAGADGKLYARDANTGAAISGFPKTVGTVASFASPVFAAGVVYQIGHVQSTLTSRIYAFSAANGTPVAGYPITPGAGVVCAATPIVTGGKLWVGCENGRIYGYDVATRAPLPGFPVTVTGTPSIDSAIAYAGGRLYFGAADGNLRAYDASTGALVFANDMSGPFDSHSPAIAGNVVYVQNLSLDFHSADRSSGNEFWWSINGFTMNGNGASGTPAIAGATAFPSDLAGYVFGVNTANGGMLWSTRIDRSASSGSPIVANGVVYLASGQRTYALDAASGAVLWHVSGGVVSNQNPVVANGKLYVASAGKGLTAYGLRGTAAASLAADRPTMSTLVPDRSLKPQ